MPTTMSHDIVIQLSQTKFKWFDLVFIHTQKQYQLHFSEIFRHLIKNGREIPTQFMWFRYNLQMLHIFKYLSGCFEAWKNWLGVIYVTNENIAWNQLSKFHRIFLQTKFHCWIHITFRFSIYIKSVRMSSLTFLQSIK